MGWYAVEAIPKADAEFIARDEIASLGIKTWLPTCRRTRRSHHRGAREEVSLLPRYLFAAFDIVVDKALWPSIPALRSVKSLLGIATNGGVPLQVRDEDIARLHEVVGLLSTAELLATAKPRILPADTIVRILWGPLQGRAGRIALDNGNRADVLLSSAGAVNKISLPRELIEAA